MADIITLADHRKKPEEKLTIEQLASECVAAIAGDWERFARNNRLNDYFLQHTPQWTREKVDYLSDLSALSVIENKIGLGLYLVSPEASASTSQLGWVAGFKLNGVRFETPPMAFEAYARCFNILLFLKLGRELTQNGIPIE